MQGIIDIPKIYTAHAEWMACLAAILIYCRYTKKSLWTIFRFVLVLAASYIAIRFFQYQCQEHDGLIWLGAMFCSVIVMLVTIKLGLGVSWRVASYISARTLMWAELAASLEWQCYYFYTFASDVHISASSGMWISLVSYGLIYLLYFFLERRALPRQIETPQISVHASNIVFAWTITILLFGLSNLSYLVRNTPFSGSNIVDIFYIRTLSDLVGVVMGHMYHLQKRDTEQREENAAFQNVLRNQYIQFRESKDNIEMINRKYHDLKHQLLVLRETVSDAERISYIDEIRCGIERYETQNKTGNDVLDTVLASKQSRCLNEGITMTVVADGTLIERLSVMDICAIFGNALDNAIEYEMRIDDPERRLIHMTVSEKNNFVCILVENYYEGADIADGTFPETTKKNRQYHGFGLKSVKYTCEKYGGCINTGVRDNWFRLEIIFPKE